MDWKTLYNSLPDTGIRVLADLGDGCEVVYYNHQTSNWYFSLTGDALNFDILRWCYIT